MKKNFFTVFVTIISALTIIGCEKERLMNFKSDLIEDLPGELQELYELMPQRNYGNITVIGDGILRFVSEDHLENVYNMLKEDCETWDDLFLERYSYLTPEDLEDEEENLEYNEFQPLIEFENRFGILGIMLRDQQELVMDYWYNNGMGGSIPIDSLFPDEVEQALYSAHHEICVGDTIAQYREDGSIILIPITMLNSIDSIRAQTVEEILSTGILKVKQGTSSSSSYIDHVAIPNEIEKNIIYGYSGKILLYFSSNPRNCFLSDNVKIKATTKIFNLEYLNGSWKKVRRTCSVVSEINIHAVIPESISLIPPVSINQHYTNGGNLVGNTLPEEKNRKSRTDVYVHPTKYPKNYVELGIGKSNSRVHYSIDQIENYQTIYN